MPLNTFLYPHPVPWIHVSAVTRSGNLPQKLDRFEVVDFAPLTARTCPRKLDRFEVEDFASRDLV
jgi:hypothetical protein